MVWAPRGGSHELWQVTVLEGFKENIPWIGNQVILRAKPEGAIHNGKISHQRIQCVVYKCVSPLLQVFNGSLFSLEISSNHLLWPFFIPAYLSNFVSDSQWLGSTRSLESHGIIHKRFSPELGTCASTFSPNHLLHHLCGTRAVSLSFTFLLCRQARF